jgi:hypothetical protein
VWLMLTHCLRLHGRLPGCIAMVGLPLVADGVKCSFNAQRVRLGVADVEQAVCGKEVCLDLMQRTMCHSLTTSIWRQTNVFPPTCSGYDWMYVAAHDGCLDLMQARSSTAKSIVRTEEKKVVVQCHISLGVHCRGRLLCLVVLSKYRRVGLAAQRCAMLHRSKCFLLLKTDRLEGKLRPVLGSR